MDIVGDLTGSSSNGKKKSQKIRYIVKVKGITVSRHTTFGNAKLKARKIYTATVHKVNDRGRSKKGWYL